MSNATYGDDPILRHWADQVDVVVASGISLGTGELPRTALRYSAGLAFVTASQVVASDLWRNDRLVGPRGGFLSEPGRSFPMQLLLVGLNQRERAPEEVRACDRIAGRLNVCGDQHAVLAIGGGDAVQSDAAGMIKQSARVHDGSYRHS